MTVVEIYLHDLRFQLESQIPESIDYYQTGNISYQQTPCST